MGNKANILFEVLMIINDFKFGNNKEAEIRGNNWKCFYVFCEGAVNNGVQTQDTLIHLNK